MSRAAALCSSVLPALLLAACVDAPDLGAGEFEKGGFPGDDCPEWGCTGNSPTMGPYAFHDLRLDGSPNSAGIIVDGIYLANNGPQVRVSFAKGKQIIAEDFANNQYTGTQLDGLTFKLSAPGGHYLLTINRVTPAASSLTTMWIGDPERVETYEVIWADYATPTRTQPVCANPPGHEEAPGGGNAWPNLYEAIFFTGDEYDAVKKLITNEGYDRTDGLLNIACAGSALAKSFLTRHTLASSDDDHHPGLAEKQALLKMYTGDFCGEGVTFTQPGTPLRWENTPGWSEFDGTETGFEAFWNEDGATCLTQHRIDSVWQAAVTGLCGLPACQGSPFPSSWPAGAYLKTAIPAP